jgi:ABC-type transport system substrate-binding protein
VKPETYFLSALATPVGGIVDQRWVLAHHGQIKTQPMGTGPFIFKSWTPGQSLVMVRNPHYWQHGLPHLEKVVVQMDVNPQLEYERFLSHQVQLIGGSLSSSMQIGSAAYLSLIREPSLRRASYVRAILPQEYNFEIQPVGPLAQQKVRLAIAYALNPKAIATQMNGRIVLGGSLVPPGLVGYDPSLKPYPYDPAMARRLLREAGYGHGLSTTLVTVNDPETKNIDEVIQTELGQVGIHVTIRALSIGAYIAAVLKKGDAPLSWGFWLAQFPNGVNFMFGQFDGHSPYVIQGYNDPKVNALIEAANSASSTAVQGRLLRQAQVMVVRQDVPAVPIGYGVTDLLKAPNLMPAAAVYYAHPIYEIQWKYLWLK